MFGFPPYFWKLFGEFIYPKKMDVSLPIQFNVRHSGILLFFLMPPKLNIYRHSVFHRLANI